VNCGVMPPANGIALLVSVLAVAGCVEGADAIASCRSDSQPIVRVAPEFPPKLHNEFEGHAQVEYTVTSNGAVRDARIVSAEWRPVGNARAESQCYDDAILLAVSRWKYAPVERPCIGTTRITFEFED
jgi:TonB family protein